MFYPCSEIQGSASLFSHMQKAGFLTMRLNCSRHHYANMPMLYVAIFKGRENVRFDISIIFAQYIDCGYMLESPRLLVVLTITHNLW